MVRHHHVVIPGIHGLNIDQTQTALCRPVHLLTSQVPLVIDWLRARGYHAQHKGLSQNGTPALRLRHDARGLRYNYRYHIRLHSSRQVTDRHHVIICIRRCHTRQRIRRTCLSTQRHTTLAPLIGDRCRANGGDRQFNAVTLNQRQRLRQLRNHRR